MPHGAPHGLTPVALAAALMVSLPSAPPASACTNFLITRAASVDGSTMISYAADSHEMYGELYHHPARRHRQGAKRKVIEWDTGKLIGSIKEARRTFLTVGNMNEHQVAIGETTFGGRKELRNPKGGIDYGSLMYVALQRAKTARQAIKIMGALVAEYGYMSSGESFSISDPKEVWIMEMIGKGPGRKGAVWVARRVPDGYVSAHANQARIRGFPKNDPDNCLHSPDVISFAREKGYFKGPDSAFSFTAAYSPMTFKKLRICEARVWSMFRRVAPSANLTLDYINGVPGARPLPLWIKPDRKLAVRDVMHLMRDHFEGTPLDLTGGVGAGPFNLPYRWRPLTWKVGGVEYLNERATATQQTGFSFVSQSRSSLPDAIGGVLWFGVDDAASTVYVPMYCSIGKPPKNFAVGTGNFTTFTWDSSFWVFNWVANFAYSRYRDMIKEIRAVQGKLEGAFFAAQPGIEKKALALHKRSPARARAFLTRYSVEQGRRVHARWRLLGQQLLMKFLDGNIRDKKGKITHPPYPQHWLRRIVKERGAHFKMRRLPGEPIPADDKKKARPTVSGQVIKTPSWWN